MFSYNKSLDTELNSHLFKKNTWKK